MHLLVRTPSPYLTESLFGFVLRISEKNGCETPWHILRMAGLQQGQMRATRFPLVHLAAILGKSPGELEHIANRVERMDSLHFKILGHSLGKSLKETPLRKKDLALCPHCVKEDGYIDAFWDLEFAVACPKHQCEVLRRCTDCGKNLRLFRPSMLMCQCGADLSKVLLAQIDNGLAELMGLVKAKLHGQSLFSVPNETGFPVQSLASIPFREFLMILGVLGEVQLKSREDGAVNPPLLIAQGAVEVLRQWPNGYHQMLRRMGERVSGKNKNAGGLRKQFMSFYVSMFKNKIFGKDTIFLKEEFVKFGLTVWENATVDHKIMSDLSAELRQRFLSKSALAREHQIWRTSMNRMLENGTLVTKTVVSGKSRRVVIDMEHSELPAISTAIVTDREAAAKVGVPVSVLRHLRSVGLFEAKPRLTWESSWYVDDVDAFSEKVRAMVLELVELPEGGILLRDVMRLKLRDKVEKADIVVAVFDGRLKALGRLGIDLGTLVLERSSVDELVAIKRADVNGSGYSFNV